MKSDTLVLTEKKIVVTGVSRAAGIGAAITRRLSEAGASVVIHGHPQYDRELNYADPNENFAADFVSELNRQGGDVYTLQSSDISLPGEPERVIKTASQKLGNLDGLVLNHAYSTGLPLGEWTAEHIDKHMNANVRASMLLIQEFTGRVKESGGSIVLFTSGQFLGPMFEEMAYSVSKEAIRGLCEQAACLLAPKRIRVNCINPGPTDTCYRTGDDYDKVASMFPSGRWGTPDDAAKLVQFLLSDFSLWITGQTISSEGGFNRYI